MEHTVHDPLSNREIHYTFSLIKSLWNLERLRKKQPAGLQLLPVKIFLPSSC